jgi:hypothetical protein
VALLGLVVVATFTREHDHWLAPQHLAPAVCHQALDRELPQLAAAALPPQLTPTERAAVLAAIDGAFLAGFRWMPPDLLWPCSRSARRRPSAPAASWPAPLLPIQQAHALGGSRPQRQPAHGACAME